MDGGPVRDAADVTFREWSVAADGARIHVADTGGDGPVVVLLHGLAGSGRELLATAEALAPAWRVLVMDQRGHGSSTRRPPDTSRQAFVSDVVTVARTLAPGRQVSLVGQSMGAHTAFLTAHAHPRLVDRLVMLEGHVRGGEPGEAAGLAAWLATWPVPFADEGQARAFLGASPLAAAWVADLEQTSTGLRPRFDADVMGAVLAAVHEPRWDEWSALAVPTLAVFAEHGMFTPVQQDELVAARPATERACLLGAGHDAHLEAFDAWATLLRDHLRRDVG